VKTTLKAWATRLKAEALTLWFVARHPDTPWLAKTLAALAAAYAFSPIDLIPDFIPVLGYVDDLLLLPLIIAVAIRMVPEPVWRQCRAQAELAAEKPVSPWAAVVIALIWLGLAVGLGRWLWSG
jgi:uncharacterized membrane protein YkvA (DUF1232 family)